MKRLLQLSGECSRFLNSPAPAARQVALLTGGRVRIGYQIALRLLRAGAECHVTSRFPQDAALRFSLEHDYKVWSGRLR